jgi:phosphocarrier protein
MMTINNLSRDVRIVNELGLHARAAAKIARLAGGAGAGVWVIRGPERADATHIMDILTLASEKGTTLTLAVEDPADHPVLEALVRLFESGFGE